SDIDSSGDIQNCSRRKTIIGIRVNSEEIGSNALEVVGGRDEEVASGKQRGDGGRLLRQGAQPIQRECVVEAVVTREYLRPGAYIPFDAMAWIPGRTAGFDANLLAVGGQQRAGF